MEFTKVIFSNIGQKSKQHSGESSDLQRGSSHESGDSDTLHQITLVSYISRKHVNKFISFKLLAGATTSATARPQYRPQSRNGTPFIRYTRFLWFSSAAIYDR